MRRPALHRGRQPWALAPGELRVAGRCTSAATLSHSRLQRDGLAPALSSALHSAVIAHRSFPNVNRKMQNPVLRRNSFTSQELLISKRGSLGKLFIGKIMAVLCHKGVAQGQPLKRLMDG